MSDHPAGTEARAAGHGAGYAAGHAAGHVAPAVAHEAAKLGLWTFLATEVLLFGGLFTTYIVYRIQYPRMFHEGHLRLDRVLGATNTVILICSSLSVALAIAAIRQGRRERLARLLWLTILFAAAFLGIKYVEYAEKFSHGLYPGTDIFFSLYFMMTGLHGLHVIGGMAVIGALALLAGRGRFTAEYHTPVEIAGLYWHFVDLVWIYLFPLFYLVG